MRKRKCACGRLLASAETHSLQIHNRHFTYHLCACGVEWTTTELVSFEKDDVVTSGEVLAVHERMAGDGLIPLSELVS